MTEPLLHGRVAVVTGAGQGIGREIGRTLTAHGARVVLADASALSSYVTGAVIEVGGGRYM